MSQFDDDIINLMVLELAIGLRAYAEAQRQAQLAAQEKPPRKTWKEKLKALFMPKETK